MPSWPTPMTSDGKREPLPFTSAGACREGGVSMGAGVRALAREAAEGAEGGRTPGLESEERATRISAVGGLVFEAAFGSSTGFGLVGFSDDDIGAAGAGNGAPAVAG